MTTIYSNEFYNIHVDTGAHLFINKYNLPLALPTIWPILNKQNYKAYREYNSNPTYR